MYIYIYIGVCTEKLVVDVSDEWQLRGFGGSGIGGCRMLVAGLGLDWTGLAIFFICFESLESRVVNVGHLHVPTPR